MRRAWILVVTAILGLTVLGTGLSLGSLQANTDRAASERGKSHTQDVRMETQGLLSALQDAEMGQRGQLIVNQPEYLGPYEAGRREAIARLDRLAGLTTTSPVQQRQIAALRILVATKLRELEEAIDHARAGDRAGARGIVASGRGEAIMDEIRAHIATIQTDESRLLGEQALAASRAAQSDRNFTYALQGFGLLMLLGVSGLVIVSSRRAGQAHQAAVIAASEERLRHALEAGRMVAWESDLTTGMETRSNNAADILGLAAVGPYAEIFALIHLDDRARVEALHHAALRGEADYNTEFRVLTKDGRELWITDHAQVHRDSNGRANMVGIRSDTTVRKAAELAANAAAARFRAAVDAVQGILWTNDAAGEMQGEQTGWAKLTGQTAEEYQGFGWAQAVHPDDAQPTIDAWNIAVAERRKFEFEHRVRRYDGEWRHCSIRAVPTLDAHGSIVEWVGVHTDITEQREAKARQQLFLTLADRLRDLSDPLDVEAAASEVLGRFLGVSRVGYGEISADGAMVAHEACYADGVAPLVGIFPIEAFGHEMSPSCGAASR